MDLAENVKKARIKAIKKLMMEQQKQLKQQSQQLKLRANPREGHEPRGNAGLEAPDTGGSGYGGREFQG